jgi:hypothetical protein
LILILSGAGSFRNINRSRLLDPCGTIWHTFGTIRPMPGNWPDAQTAQRVAQTWITIAYHYGNVKVKYPRYAAVMPPAIRTS